MQDWVDSRPSTQPVARPLPMRGGMDAPETPRQRSPFPMLVNAVRGVIVAYVVWWALSIVVGVILGQVVLAGAAASLDRALRGFCSSVPPAWSIVSFVARAFYYGMLDLRIFGPSPSSELFARSELLAMVMVTLTLVIVVGAFGVFAVRRGARGGLDA